MDNTVQIVEKPEWVTWEAIKQCLYDAHAVNREKGINMSHYQWPVEKIRDYIGENGIVLVALDGQKLVGTASFAEKAGKAWFEKGQYAYMCFAGVLPEYNGKGVYHRLIEKRETIAKLKHYDVIAFDTHINNKKIQAIAQRNGYRYVYYFRAASKDHYSVLMAKWLNGCPYSTIYCRIRYLFSVVVARLRALFS